MIYWNCRVKTLLLNVVSKEQFQKYRLPSRRKLLQEAGIYLGARYFRSYVVHLYSVSNFYVELWIRMDFEEICWIEIADNGQVAENYVGKIDLKTEFGL